MIWKKYQLKKNTVTKVLTEFALHGNHFPARNEKGDTILLSETEHKLSETDAAKPGQWLDHALSKDLEIEPFSAN